MVETEEIGTTIRCLIADDHAIFSDLLVTALARNERFSVVGTARNGREAVRMAQEQKPDLVLLDLNMPELDGIEATKQIRSLVKGARIIALSGLMDPESVSSVLEAGASGFVSKQAALKELMMAVEAAMRDEIFISPVVAKALIEARLGNKIPQAAAALSPREREVFLAIAEGKETKEVAFDLGLSINTVHTYRRGVFEKLGVQNDVELARFAIRHGYIKLPPLGSEDHS